MKQIRTVGALRKFLEQYPDDTILVTIEQFDFEFEYRTLVEDDFHFETAARWNGRNWECWRDPQDYPSSELNGPRQTLLVIGW